MKSRPIIVHPSGNWATLPTEKRLRELNQFIVVDYLAPKQDPLWPWAAGNPQQRANQLISVLFDDKRSIIWGGRGGYGASDLLSLIPFNRMKELRPKTIVGFSDISALLSAFYTKLAWRGIHGPMPLGPLWGSQKDEDIKTLMELFTGRKTTINYHVQAAVKKCGHPEILEGILFGGCLSVLTSLIGTEYLPKCFKDHILFFEDIDENCGQVIRMIRQWQQAGLLSGVTAIVMGQFVGLNETLPLSNFWKIVENEIKIPVYFSKDFGHVSPNLPIPIGVIGKIEGENEKLSCTVKLNDKLTLTKRDV